MRTGRSPCSQHLASGTNDKWTFIKVLSLAPLAGTVNVLLGGAPLLTRAGEVVFSCFLGVMMAAPLPHLVLKGMFLI